MKDEEGESCWDGFEVGAVEAKRMSSGFKLNEIRLD